MKPAGKPLNVVVATIGSTSDHPGGGAINPADRKPESTFEIRKLPTPNSVRSATGQRLRVWQAAGSTNEFCERHL